MKHVNNAPHHGIKMYIALQIYMQDLQASGVSESAMHTLVMRIYNE